MSDPVVVFEGLGGLVLIISTFFGMHLIDAIRPGTIRKVD